MFSCLSACLSLQASVRVWNVHGPNAKNFEEQYPGFAAWREQHKGVSVDVTLAATEGSGSGTKRGGKRKRKAATS
jgi:hypothetical protein